jgi:hypothetical protein
MPDMIQPADDYERAFCEAVERYSAGEWSPGRPDHPQIAAGRNRHSTRGICILVLANPRTLPERTIDQLFQTMHAQHDRLRQGLRELPTYAAGAMCLIELMDEREAAVRKENTAR